MSKSSAGRTRVSANATPRPGGNPPLAPSRANARRVEKDLIEAERLMAAGQGVLADTLLRDALQHAPHAPDVRRLAAIGALMAGRPAEALDHAQAACAAAPHRAELAMLTGRAYKALNDLPHAVDAYRRAIRLQPRLADAHVSLGIALKACGDLDSAIASYRAALAINPRLAVAHAALGNALALQIASATGGGTRFDDESLQALRRAVELDPRSATAAHNLGVALAQTGQSEQAIKYFNTALALDTSREDSCVLLHATLSKLNYLETARQCCERWLALNTPTAGVTNRLVTTLLASSEFDAALAWAETAYTLAPDMPEVLHNLAAACQLCLDVPAALEYLRRAIEVAPGYRPSREVLLMSLNYVEEDPRVILRAHRTHAPLPPPTPVADPVPRGAARGGRLRIGYVSGDFRRHSVSYFMEPVFAAHDRSRFEVIAYHTAHASDEVTARLKARTTAWVDAADLSDDDFAARIRGDGIDVLVDLSGHTADGRLAVFARRPAPVQMSYLGYPTTTGSSAIDYRLSDGVIDPIGCDTWSTETVLRFERGMFCYRPDAEPEVGPPPLQRNGHITFGSFNSFAKLSAKTLSMWAGVLHAVPGSRLYLKARSLGSSIVRSRLLQRLAALGIGAERLVLNAWRADLHSHLDVYREVDIGLDTFPFNGATTTCESLWMGVPVVTLHGATHVSRMGASILRSAGLDGWTATSVDEFIDLAAQHAAQPEALARFRAGARVQLRASALMDSLAHTANLERLILAACEAPPRHHASAFAPV